MKNLKTKGQLKFWRQKLAGYQRKYDELRKQSPDRWWHDEHFDNQLKVLDALISNTREKIRELERK